MAKSDRRAVIAQRTKVTFVFNYVQHITSQLFVSGKRSDARLFAQMIKWYRKVIDNRKYREVVFEPWMLTTDSAPENELRLINTFENLSRVPSLNFIAALVVLGILFFLSGFAFSTNAQVISGRVIDGTNGNGVAGINVHIVAIPPWTDYSVITGQNGEFALTTNIEDENNNNISTTIDADVTSVSSRPYFTIQNFREQEATITIFDITGSKVRSIQAPLMNGINNIQWDVKNDNGEIISNGIYLTRIQIGSKNIDRKFMILKGEIEGLPGKNIAGKTDKTFNKTTELIYVSLETTDPQGIYTNSRDDFTCYDDTTFNVIALSNKNIENPFVNAGQAIDKFSSLTTNFLGGKRPAYPVQINLFALPSELIFSVNQAMQNIDSLTEINFLEEGTGNITFTLVNDDLTAPIFTRNAYSQWTSTDAAGRPTKGMIYINNSHNLSSSEITGYVTKELVKLLLNSQQNAYNKKYALYPKGTEVVSKDEIELLKFQFNRRETTQYSNITTTATENINIQGIVTIPDTLTRTIKPVKGAIVHLDGAVDTTDNQGMYLFANVFKGLKNLTIDSVMADGKSDLFHQYEENVTITNDTTRNETMFPNIKLQYNFNDVNTILELWKWNNNLSNIDKKYNKSLFPIQIYINKTNMPTGWDTYLREAINEWNTKARVKLFEEVTTPYTQTDKTAMTVNYENNGGPHIGSNDATTLPTTEGTKFNMYFNTGSGMNNAQVKWANKHEPFRIIYGASLGHAYMSIRPETVGFPERPLDPNLGQITNDDAITAFILSNMPALIRINNYIK